MSEAAQVGTFPTTIDIARVCHEANRGWRQACGEQPGPSWDATTQAHRDAVREGVELAIGGAMPEQMHESWMNHWLAKGWVYAPGAKNEEAMTHPNLVSWWDLPLEQRMKDELFVAIVRALVS